MCVGQLRSLWVHRRQKKRKSVGLGEMWREEVQGVIQPGPLLGLEEVAGLLRQAAL